MQHRTNGAHISEKFAEAGCYIARWCRVRFMLWHFVDLEGTVGDSLQPHAASMAQVRLSLLDVGNSLR